jgi:hypothetical protein
VIEGLVWETAATYSLAQIGREYLKGFTYEETQIDKSAVVPGRFNLSSQFLFRFTGGNCRNGGRSSSFGAGPIDEQWAPGESAGSVNFLAVNWFKKCFSTRANALPSVSDIAIFPTSDSGDLGRFF